MNDFPRDIAATALDENKSYGADRRNWMTQQHIGRQWRLKILPQALEARTYVVFHGHKSGMPSSDLA
jgi:hypothetical protein